MSEQFYISRDDQHRIVELLREIPALAEDLAVTVTRQDRIGTGGPRLRRGDDEQPLPFNAHASEVADDLQGVLVAWARHVCEMRAMPYGGSPGMVGVARWLDRHVVSLALTEGTETALDEIDDAIRRARRAIDRPATGPGEDREGVDEDRMAQAREAARGQWVTPAQAEALLPRLGYVRVRAVTIRQWASRGKIESVSGWYQLGAIMDRTRHAKRLDALSHPA